MPGGTAFYCSHAIRHFNDIDYALVTAVGVTEMNVVEQLREMGIHVTALPSKYSVYFENIYGANPDDRTQRVLAKADPFTAGQLKDIDAQIYHLGSLLADDFSLEVIKELSQKGLIAVDSQGYLREVRDTHVYPVDWIDKREALQYIHFLKVNEHEMEVLTGLSDPHEAARQLHEWGVKEVLVTLGSMGSLIFDGKDFYRIPAYKPKEVVDATRVWRHVYHRLFISTGIRCRHRRSRTFCSSHVNFKNREIRSFQWQQRRCHSMYDHCGTDVLKQEIIKRTAYI